MKRFLLLLSLFVFLFFLLLGLLAFNLEYLLNRPIVKDKIRAFLAEKTDLKVNFGKIDINLYKLLFSFENLEIKGRDFELSLPKVRADYDWDKLLSLNFYPRKVYLKNPYLKVVWSEEPITFTVEDFKGIIKRVALLELFIKNATIDYEVAKNTPLRLSLETLNLSNRVPQVLLEAKGTSPAFTSLHLNLRYNYRDEFLESSLRVKKFDLTRLKLRDLSILSKTEFDFDLELSLEKGIINAGFTGSAPCIALKEADRSFVCGIFQGFFVGNFQDFELRLSPVDLKYPEVKGDLLLTRKAGLYRLVGNLGNFRWEEVREFVSPHLPKELSEEIFGRVRGGYFHDIAFLAEGRDFSHLLRPENLQISARVEAGEVYLPERNLTFTSLAGKVAFKDRGLYFTGTGKLEEVISLSAQEFYLDLFSEKKSLSLTCDFTGEATYLQKLGLAQIEELNFLEDWEVRGGLAGTLILEGPLEDLSVKASLRPEALKIKIPFLKNWLSWERGILIYKDKKLILEDSQISSEENYIRKVFAEFALDTHYLSLRSEDSLLGRDLLFELSEGHQGLRDIWLKHKLSFSKLLLEKVSYEGFLPSLGEKPEISSLLEALKVKGKVLDLSFTLPYQGRDYLLKSEELSFDLRDSLIFLNPSKIFYQDTLLEISGRSDYTLSNFVLVGKGIIGEETLREIQEFTGLLNSPLALRRVPLEIEDFSLSLRDTSWDFAGKGRLENLILEVSVEKRKGLKIQSKAGSKESLFKLRISQTSPLIVEYRGKLEFQELAGIFLDPPIDKGKIEGNFSVEVFPEKVRELKERFSREDLNHLLKKYLGLRPLKLNGEARLSEVKLKRPSPLVLSGDFRFQGETVEGKDISLIVNNSSLKGNLALLPDKDLLTLQGNLTLQALNLRELAKEAKTKKAQEPSWLEKVFSLPLKGELFFTIENLTLPTSHGINYSMGKLLLEEKKLLRVEFPQIDFCGLRLSSELEKNSQFQYLFIDLPSSKGELLDLFSCLYPEEMPQTILEGPFKMEGFFYTDGEKGFFQHSFGQLEITSERGYLYRAPLIARVLAFLSPIDLFRGKIPNLENNLLPYEELNFKGEFLDASLYIDTLFLSAPGFRLFGSGPLSLSTKEVNLTFLVSPFKTIDVIVEHIPYLNRWILGKERMFIYLPLEVTGTYEQPSIIPLHPASIGKGLFRFIFKFFGLGEDFFKKEQNFDRFKKGELLQKRSGDSLPR